MTTSSDRMGRYIPVVQLFAARLVLFHQKVAERLGLTATEFKSLRLLEQLGPLSLTALAQEAGLQLSTMSGLVDKLAAADLVVRKRDPSDGRRMLLAASPRAAARASSLYRKHGVTMAAVLDRYGRRDFDAVMRFLEDASLALAQSSRELDETAPVAAR